jgi:polyisoprenoid-binding protein YceI
MFKHYYSSKKGKTMSTATATQTATWAIDNAHSEISFKVKHLMITNVTGYFREFGGHITPAEQGWEGASVEFFAKTASVDTNQKDRDAHLQSDDFLIRLSTPNCASCQRRLKTPAATSTR